MKIGNLFLDIKAGDVLWIGKAKLICISKPGHPHLMQLQVQAPEEIGISLEPRPWRPNGREAKLR